MDDYREFVAQMRQAAPRSDDAMQVSKELWLRIADVIEEQGNEIDTLSAPESESCERAVDDRPYSGGVLRVPCLPGAMVRFKMCESAWKVVCINFYAEGIPTASVTNGKITNTMPLEDLAEAEVLRKE